MKMGKVVLCKYLIIYQYSLIQLNYEVQVEHTPFQHISIFKSSFLKKNYFYYLSVLFLSREDYTNNSYCYL